MYICSIYFNTPIIEEDVGSFTIKNGSLHRLLEEFSQAKGSKIVGKNYCIFSPPFWSVFVHQRSPAVVAR
jgi:hypothetical protein